MVWEDLQWRASIIKHEIKYGGLSIGSRRLLSRSRHEGKISHSLSFVSTYIPIQNKKIQWHILQLYEIKNEVSLK